MLVQTHLKPCRVVSIAVLKLAADAPAMANAANSKEKTSRTVIRLVMSNLLE
jgi:hypothetical protein